MIVGNKMRGASRQIGWGGREERERERERGDKERWIPSKTVYNHTLLCSDRLFTTIHCYVQTGCLQLYVSSGQRINYLRRVNSLVWLVFFFFDTPHKNVTFLTSHPICWLFFCKNANLNHTCCGAYPPKS